MQRNMNESVLLVIKVEAWRAEMQVVGGAGRSEDAEGFVCEA